MRFVAIAPATVADASDTNALANNHHAADAAVALTLSLIHI